MVKYPMDMVIVMSQVSFICPSPSPLLSSWLLRVPLTSENSLVHIIPQNTAADLSLLNPSQRISTLFK